MRWHCSFTLGKRHSIGLSEVKLSPRFCARPTVSHRLDCGSTGLRLAHPNPDIFLCLVRPTSLTVAVNLSPSPKTATNFPCLASEPFLARQIGVGFQRRHFLRKCGRLTAPFRAMGRALPSPTLFRRIHAYSVRSDWPVCSPSAEGEPSPNRSTQEEATDGSQISAPEILDLRL